MSRFITLGVIAGLGASLVATPAIAQQPVAQPVAQPAAAASTVSAAGITLHSVSVDLPNSDRTFPGSGDAEAINANCLTCHSAGMVLNQPTLTRAAWRAEVEKMRGQYKAPVDEADVPAIVAYLAKYKGPK
ncbi:c-type cytochrome [Rhodopila sp.]|uniref:c-type cytochrome n=1 Tax=Rhodopila sp. TaxID=2480087 RepID=UPI003D109727